MKLKPDALALSSTRMCPVLLIELWAGPSTKLTQSPTVVVKNKIEAQSPQTASKVYGRS